MTRLALPLAVATAALVAAAPALAADYGMPGGSGYSNFFGNSDDLRSGFSSNWDNSDAADPLSFELGVRYWYSMGAQSFGVGPYTLSESDKTSSAEAQFRIDDASTKSYVKGLAGMSFDINGSGADTALGTTTTVTNGRIAYAGADFGSSLLGGGRNAPSFGPLIGYMYWNDSPNIGRANYTVGTSTSDFTFDPGGGLGNEILAPGDSQEDSIEVNALRLGFSGKANFGNAFDVSGELAAVPYAKIGGTLGAFGVRVADDGSFSTIQSSAADINGWGYGAMGELMVGFHPTSNLTFRVGGRAWYLQGRSDTSFNTITVQDANPATVVGTQRYISTDNPWSLFRYGALAEMTYNF